MTAYYNEHDTFAAQWLRELIKAGLIADGEVDERDIQDVRPDDLRGFTQCHFFAGIGGWSYALRLAGWPDDRPVWTGSCPCQPFSAAGQNLGGDDPRHLWPAWFRLIQECRPSVVFGEQVSAAIAHGWLDLVFDDLEREGYATGAVGLPACSVGAFHIRQRLWFVAESESAERHRGGVAWGWRNGSPDVGAVGLMADTAKSGREALRPCAKRPRSIGETGLHGAASIMADANGGQSRHGRVQRSGEHGLRAQGGCPDGREGDAEQPEVGELGQSIGAGLEGFAGHGDDGTQPGRIGTGAHRSITEAGPWADVVWLPCRDGKARPTQSGLFPLAYGVSGRVGRLRGYGNAIVPQVAAAFIEAYCEARLTP